ncbi:Uncharacterized protein BM_BM17745 [Brugia malayi]|nr:Uncharacterized protein BM_BM17745 [Brugia malayi]VIO97970.1 Uncharacterized protein BM_BM17745 [Brugia malayi]
MEIYSPIASAKSLQQISGNFHSMLSTNWQEWSNWSKCRNDERTRFRLCVSPLSPLSPLSTLSSAVSSSSSSTSQFTNDTMIINSTNFNNNNNNNNATIEMNLLTICELNKIETEKQICFKANKNEKLVNLNPFMIEEEITATYLKRPKINPEPIKIVKIQRN